MSKAKCKLWLRIKLAFHAYRDWRLVIAQDASGKKGRCLLIPLEKNGIKELGDGRIEQTLFCLKRTDGSMIGANTYAIITPYISTRDYEKLKEKGDDLDESYGLGNSRALVCGYLMRPTYFAT